MSDSHSDELPPLVPGDLIAPGYRVVTPMMRSEAFDVYQVWSSERQCSCVAKTLRMDEDAQPKRERAHRRLLQEGRLLQEFTHPHFVRAYETLDQPTPTIVLETLPGATLDHLIYDGNRRLRAIELAHLGTHLCSALQYLHNKGYLHLDIKPGNVISTSGLAKLLDLSLARPPGPCPPGMGTRAYLAPEQASGDFLTSAADIWGLGATLYEAAAGKAPFEPLDEGEADRWRKDEETFFQLERKPPPLRRLRRGLPSDFLHLIDACLESDPSRRPSLAEVASSLMQMTGPPPPSE